jgi:hypothetical protein
MGSESLLLPVNGEMKPEFIKCDNELPALAPTVMHHGQKLSRLRRPGRFFGLSQGVTNLSEIFELPRPPAGQERCTFGLEDMTFFAI